VAFNKGKTMASSVVKIGAIFVGICALLGVVGAFRSNPNSLETQSGTPIVSAKPKVSAMRFGIETVMLSDLFQNNLKVAKVNASVEGGSENEWIATAILIAKRVAGYGADSVEVVIDRTDLDSANPVPAFRHIAQVYYSPDQKHSVWDKGNLIMASEQLATIKDVQVNNEYWRLEKKFTDAGMGPDMADKKAGAMVARKFKLSQDWQLFEGGPSEKKMGFDDFDIDSTLANDTAYKLDLCMRGKIIRMLKTCDE